MRNDGEFFKSTTDLGQVSTSKEATGMIVI